VASKRICGLAVRDEIFLAESVKNWKNWETWICHERNFATAKNWPCSCSISPGVKRPSGGPGLIRFFS
jgi:hypothetical protein